MAASQLRAGKIQGGPSPSVQSAADEGGAIRYRDILHGRFERRGRQDPEQMVSGVAIRPKSKARWTELDRIH
jgi:hypothetical protein